MKNLNILIVEGNLKEENQNFSEVGIQTHTESLKVSLNNFTNDLNFDVVNPSSDENLDLVNEKLSNYDGLIWGGSSLNIYNDTPEIKRQIEFMKQCQKKVKNILAICWGMQVAVTAAGGLVKKANNSIKFLAVPIFNPIVSKPTITPSRGPAPKSAPTYIAVPAPIKIIPKAIRVRLKKILSDNSKFKIIKSATIPTKKISTIVPNPGFCFKGIQRSITATPVIIIVLP